MGDKWALGTSCPEKSIKTISFLSKSRFSLESRYPGRPAQAQVEHTVRHQGAEEQEREEEGLFVPNPGERAQEDEGGLEQVGQDADKAQHSSPFPPSSPDFVLPTSNAKHETKILLNRKREEKYRLIMKENIFVTFFCVYTELVHLRSKLGESSSLSLACIKNIEMLYYYVSEHPKAFIRPLLLLQITQPNFYNKLI